MIAPDRHSFRDIREELDAVAAEDRTRRIALLKVLANAAATLPEYSYVASKIRILAEAEVSDLGKGIRLAILRSHTVEPIIQPLAAVGFGLGMYLDVRLGGFNTVELDAISGHGLLSVSSCDSVLIIRGLDDVAPELGRDYYCSNASAIDAAIQRAVDGTERVLDGVRGWVDGPVFAGLYVPPPQPAHGLADDQSERGQWGLISELNQRIRGVVSSRAGVFVLGLDRLASTVGLERWFDSRSWESVRLPYSSAAIEAIAPFVGKSLACAAFPGIKCLVCDLDNTLWGGVIGEEGPEHLAIGPSGDGAYFQALHRSLLGLRARGVLLAIASKNNPADVAPMFNDHAGMLLKAEHFASSQIGWGDKAESIRKIAQELNIGIDAVAFLDDNPAERALVQAELPGVRVLPFPEHPSGLESVVHAEVGLQRLEITLEDAGRADMYTAQKARASLADSSSNMEEYYNSLEQKITFRSLSEASVARIAQMTQKTNQFNLTTRRYAQSEIASILTSRSRRAFLVEVCDRFGDNGVVGAAIVESGESWHLDSFLLSCRVIGRMVEFAFLSLICEQAVEAGAKALTAEFIPTAKNMPAAKFLRDFGMERSVGDADGTDTEHYRLGLESGVVSPVPPYFEIHRS